MKVYTEVATGIHTSEFERCVIWIDFWSFGTIFIFPYIGNVIIPIDFHIFPELKPPTRFGGFFSGGCGLCHVLRGEELVAGRGARHATPGQAPAHQSVLLDGTLAGRGLTWLRFTSSVSRYKVI